MPLRIWIAGVATSAVIASAPPSAARQAPAARAPCINIRHGIPRGGKIITPGTQAHVTPGVLVFVVLVEAAAYTTARYPTVFPWLTPTSSNPPVLRPVPLCSAKNLPATTLPVRVAAFRARRPGRAYLSARLSKAWRKATRTPFTAYRAVVLVGARN
jgi:hypothetical protein